MKKVFLLLIFTCLFLVSCTPNPKTTSHLSVGTAKSIALKACPTAEIISTVSDFETPKPNYIISLRDLQKIYTVQIDAITGQITKQCHQPLDSPYPNVSISIIQAKESAQNYHKGELCDFYLITLDDTPHYIAFINDGTYIYQLSINALTGSVSEINHFLISNT